MANLPETPTWETGIYQIEQTDPVVGGPPDLAQGQGISNVPAQQLANRTKWLNDQITALQTAVGSAASQADIDAAINALIGGAPAALDTLNELAAALADDANYATNITNALAGKVDLVDNVLTGALGSIQTSPTTALQDWNAPENIKSGVSKYLLFGGWTNGPGTNGNYHVMNFEYGSRTGNGNLTQIAIPYRIDGSAAGLHTATCIHYRIRQSGVWSAWMRVLNDEDLGPAYEYTLTSWTDNTAVTLIHGLGAVPRFVDVTYVCTTIDNGYSVGDEIRAQYNQNYNNIRGLGVTKNNVNIKLQILINNSVKSDASGYFVMAPANWNIKVRAWE